MCNDKNFDKQAITSLILMHNQAAFQSQHVDSQAARAWMKTSECLELTTVVGAATQLCKLFIVTHGYHLLLDDL